MRKDLKMIPIRTSLQLAMTAKAAKDIWNVCYKDTYSKPQLTYMLKKEQSYDTIKRQLAENYLYFSTNVKCQPVGYFCTRQEEDGMMLRHLYIQEPHRRTGISKDVIAYVEELGRLRKQKTLYLYCNKENTSAIEAFKALGFTVDGEETRDWGEGYTSEDIRMSKEIPPRKPKV